MVNSPCDLYLVSSEIDLVLFFFFFNYLLPGFQHIDIVNLVAC